MAGEEVVQIRGRSTKENPCGWHFHRSLMRMSIRQVPRFLFLRLPRQESLLTMVQPALTKSLTDAGRISLTAARWAALCVPRDRVPPRQLVQGNGSFHKVQGMEHILFISTSLL